MGRRKPTKQQERNRAAKKARRAKQFAAQAELCRGMACCYCGFPPPSDPDHVLPRGANGKDYANVVPLCRIHHDIRHAVGIKTFCLEWVDIRALAKELALIAYPNGSP